MAIVDDNGRLFGRLNLLDAFILVVLCGLIPLGYASWRIFRTPAPYLTGISPETINSPEYFRLTIHGANLLPYMRVSLGTVQGATFLFRDSSEAEVAFRKIPPGVYDIRLYDNEKERAMLPKALTVLPSPIPTSRVVLIGELGGLSPEQAAQVKPGLMVSGFGPVAAVAPPVPQAARVYGGAQKVLTVTDPTLRRVPVRIDAGCFVRSREGRSVCEYGDIDLLPGVLVMVDTPIGQVALQLDQVLGSAAPTADIKVTVRFAGEPAALSQIARDDVDLARAVNPLAVGARVVEMRSVAGATREVTLAMAAQKEDRGWIYSGDPVRIGGPFVFLTPRYQISGTVIGLVAPPETK